MGLDEETRQKFSVFLALHEWASRTKLVAAICNYAAIPIGLGFGYWAIVGKHVANPWVALALLFCIYVPSFVLNLVVINRFNAWLRNQSKLQ
jgi:ABC-type dipeptide/oligopeptide/nickel transport system permease component